MNLISRFKAAGPGIALGAVSALAILAILAIAGTVMTVQCGASCGTIEKAG